MSTPTIAVTLAITPEAPAHGDTVTATYTVTGNDPVAESTEQISGQVVLATVAGPVTLDAVTTITMPGTAALPETFEVPTAAGLTFEATGEANVFTAVVP
jgi:hypothetical protein